MRAASRTRVSVAAAAFLVLAVVGLALLRRGQLFSAVQNQTGWTHEERFPGPPAESGPHVRRFAPSKPPRFESIPRSVISEPKAFATLRGFFALPREVKQTISEAEHGPPAIFAAEKRNEEWAPQM